jgi:hypothetical protein
VYLQELWAAKVQWDEPLSGHLLKKWVALVNGLRCDEVLSLPTVLTSIMEGAKYQLCGFGDASQKEYEAVIYF